MLDYGWRGEEMIQLMTKKKITFGKEECHNLKKQRENWFHRHSYNNNLIIHTFFAVVEFFLFTFVAVRFLCSDKDDVAGNVEGFLRCKKVDVPKCLARVPV